jgi:hypothetical protein
MRKNDEKKEIKWKKMIVLSRFQQVNDVGYCERLIRIFVKVIL